jgi:hypothetical protein
MKPRQKRKDKDDDIDQEHGEVYTCIKCGGDCHFVMVGDEPFTYERFTHVDRRRGQDHAAYPVPQLLGVNCYFDGEGLRHDVLAEVRECGYCAEPIVRYSPSQDWIHAAEKRGKCSDYDHRATTERPGKQEIEIYKTKFGGLMAAMESKMARRAVMLSPVKKKI